MQAMASSSRAIASLLSLIALMSLLITSVVSIPALTHNSLPSGDYLRPGDRLVHNGYTLMMHKRDCKLVLYDHFSRKIWQSTNYQGDKTCRAGLEYDGSLAIRNPENEDVWNSNNQRAGLYPFEIFINAKRGAVEIKDKMHETMWSSKDDIKP